MGLKRVLAGFLACFTATAFPLAPGKQWPQKWWQRVKLTVAGTAFVLHEIPFYPGRHTLTKLSPVGPARHQNTTKVVQYWQTHGQGRTARLLRYAWPKNLYKNGSFAALIKPYYFL